LFFVRVNKSYLNIPTRYWHYLPWHFSNL